MTVRQRGKYLSFEHTMDLFDYTTLDLGRNMIGILCSDLQLHTETVSIGENLTMFYVW